MNAIKICQWNANGLRQHKLEVSSYLYRNNIDVMLISETHLTYKNYIRIAGYTFYDTKHPEGKAHGGTGIFVKNTLHHYEIEKFTENYLQATTICIQRGHIKIALSAVYCPPRFSITTSQFQNFFKTLGSKFLAAGDFNAKHTFWGSRLISPRGRQLYSAVNNGMDVVSSGHPTYWPSDMKKIPDLIDFGVVKGIKRRDIKAEPSYELSSDHSPVILTLQIIDWNSSPTQITKKYVNWNSFADKIENKTPKNFTINSNKEVDEAIELLNNISIDSLNEATLIKKFPNKKKIFQSSIDLLIANKRNARREWQKHRDPNTKAVLNEETRRLKEALFEMQTYLDSLGPHEENNYSLWKAASKFKVPITNSLPIRKNDGTWARTDEDKGIVLANHLKQVFQPNPQLIDFDPFIYISADVKNPPKITLPDLKEAIKELNTKKAPGLIK